MYPTMESCVHEAVRSRFPNRIVHWEADMGYRYDPITDHRHNLRWHEKKEANREDLYELASHVWNIMVGK